MRRWLRFAAGLIWLAASVGSPSALSAAGAGAPSADTPILRYVVAVDLGAEMKPRMENIRKTVVDLWVNGISGLARTGDAIAIWPFQEQVDRTSFPVHVWISTLTQELATDADNRLKKLRPSKKSQLQGVLSALLEESKRSGVLTGILLTDGSKPVLGTPFDARINTIFIHNGAAMKEAKRPFALALLARRGEWIAWAVSAGGGKLDVPFVPDEHMAANGQTDALFNRQAPPKPSPPPPAPKPRPRGAPLIITEPKPEAATPAVATAPSPQTAPRLVAATPAQTEVPVPIPAPPSTPPKPVDTAPPATPATRDTTTVADASVPAAVPPQQNPIPKTPAPTPVPEPKEIAQPPPPVATAPIVHTPDPAPAPEPAVAQPPPSAPIHTKPVPAEIVQPGPASKLTDTPAPSEPEPTMDGVGTALVSQTSSTRQLVIALSLLAAAGGVAWMFVRSRRPPPEPSLISQSFDRERR